jgi:hypothetical protein
MSFEIFGNLVSVAVVVCRAFLGLRSDAAARRLELGAASAVAQMPVEHQFVAHLSANRDANEVLACRGGVVTSFYLPERADLAEALRQCIESGEPVEGAFSRNRSFSNKFKRYGKFVPAGQAPVPAQGDS